MAVRDVRPHYVSIHLMLLFITFITAAKKAKIEFQYISCCYLSTCRHLDYLKMNVSIHLMLLFILSGIFASSRMFKFQYISCCYLSPTAGRLMQIFTCFNTSHVVIYHFFQLSMYNFSSRFNTSHVVIYLAFSQAKRKT